MHYFCQFTKIIISKIELKYFMLTVLDSENACIPGVTKSFK